jgi:hypothetical protein
MNDDQHHGEVYLKITPKYRNFETIEINSEIITIDPMEPLYSKNFNYTIQGLINGFYQVYPSLEILIDVLNLRHLLLHVPFEQLIQADKFNSFKKLLIQEEILPKIMPKEGYVTIYEISSALSLEKLDKISFSFFSNIDPSISIQKIDGWKHFELKCLTVESMYKFFAVICDIIDWKTELENFMDSN